MMMTTMAMAAAAAAAAATTGGHFGHPLFAIRINLWARLGPGMESNSLARLARSGQILGGLPENPLCLTGAGA